jgi:hypothetical protein
VQGGADGMNKMSERREYIGYTGVTGTHGEIPEWVRHEITRLQHKYGGSSSSFSSLNTFTLKGNHFIYSLVFEGQGGSIIKVFRKPRTGGKIR